MGAKKENSMRHFSSYGPVNEHDHFSVPRQKLVSRCASQLVAPGEQDGGHFFTIWAPRQTGKTWLIRQARAQIQLEYPHEFIVAEMSMQGVVLEKNCVAEEFLDSIPLLFSETFHIELPSSPSSWNEWKVLFSKKSGLFLRPVILLIDEFDRLPSSVIDILVGLFRDIYLKRDEYVIHGLALIGVRAALGFGSDKGSPFNIQRSLQVPRFEKSEVEDLFFQYQTEVAQKIEPEVVEAVWKTTRGQPGLVCWFGELLTEKYNSDPNRIHPIGIKDWPRVKLEALFKEPNNTILNMVAKARGEHLPKVLEMFTRSDIPFRIDADWCNFLHLNGIIDSEDSTDIRGEIMKVCRFTSPFIQERLYNALCDDLVGDRMPILALDPLDDLANVFVGPELNAPVLLSRYKAYLNRLKAKGLNPWKDQPKRTDLRITEAAGHFHLYAWLTQALKGSDTVLSPEFPTGNGKVDLHLRRDHQRTVIEVKSFINTTMLEKAKAQAGHYGAQLGLAKVTLAVFVPCIDEIILTKLSGESIHEGVVVHVVTIGWEAG